MSIMMRRRCPALCNNASRKLDIYCTRTIIINIRISDQKKTAWGSVPHAAFYICPLKSNLYDPDLPLIDMSRAHREQCPSFFPSIIYRNHTLRLGNHIAIAVHVSGRNISVGNHLHAVTGVHQSAEHFVP